MKKLLFEVSVKSEIYQKLKKEKFFKLAETMYEQGEDGAVLVQVEKNGTARAIFVPHEEAKAISDILKGEGCIVKESYLKKKIRKDLPEEAWHFSPVQMGRGASGVPDIIACVPVKIKQSDVGKTLGLFTGIEAKVGKNTPTKLQMSQLKGIASAGGSALVITGQDKEPYKVKKIERSSVNDSKERTDSKKT